ncbi:hypothetical protein DHOM_03700 [Dermabacter hominis 1368]|uniref:Uncharacterized protein n=1 Tax=Dermabacter hominis 1368 TaxID=1450519 RepID=A0ABR4SQ98_9MICO|nr:hypothetical protein DHOM_03700 [Dermabacter hominis 1368]
MEEETITRLEEEKDVEKGLKERREVWRERRERRG